MMARTKKPPPNEQPKSSIHSVTLADEEVLLLQRLSQDASDFLGRTISRSAVIRALLRQIGKQGPPAADALFIELKRELTDGKIWGRKRKS